MKIKPLLPLFLVFCLCACSGTTDSSPTKQPSTVIKEASTQPLPPKEEKEPTASEKARLIMADMTLEEKVGQLFFARCPSSSAKEDVSQYALGGYILFARDFKDSTPEQLQETIESYQSASKIPLLIGVDEEGGNVVRASKYSAFRETPFLSPQQLFAESGFDGIKDDTKEKSLFLKNLGINVNLAPVCDISTDPQDFIYNRSFGQDAQNTASYISMVVTQMKENQMGSVLKHFPGYGNNVDTHTGVAYDNRPMSQFEAEDFVPFKAGINVGADSILVSHNVVNAIDSTLPASLSPKTTEILRNQLGFNGVVMTDDLAMEGVQNFSTTDTAVLAIIANYDMIISSNHHEQIEAVLAAVKRGEISDYQINSSVERILIWKINLGLID